MLTNTETKKHGLLGLNPNEHAVPFSLTEKFGKKSFCGKKYSNESQLISYKTLPDSLLGVNDFLSKQFANFS